MGEKNDLGKLPLGIVIHRQFPNAIKAIAECSRYGHNKYSETDTDWLNCQRVENGEERYLDALTRHLVDSGVNLDAKDAESGLEHIKHAAWNLLQLLEILELKKYKDARTGNSN